jgi:hypothetical protein
LITVAFTGVDPIDNGTVVQEHEIGPVQQDRKPRAVSQASVAD